MPRPDDDSDAVPILLDDPPEPAGHRGPPAIYASPSAAIQPPQAPAPYPPHAPAQYPNLDRRKAPDIRRKPRRGKSKSRRERSGYSGIAVHPSIIGGILMMVGAVVWFFLGLMFGRIFFYPPILFVAGIAAMIRGFTGSD